MQVQQLPKKTVLFISVPGNTDENTLTSITTVLINTIVLCAMMFIWHVVMVSLDRTNIVGLFINLLTILGVFLCAILGITQKNITLIKMLSCCSFYMVGNIVLGIFWLLLISDARYQRCLDCQRTGQEECRSDQNNANSDILDTTDCSQYEIGRIGGAIYDLVMAFICLLLFIGLGTFSCQLCTTNSNYFERKISPIGQQQHYSQSGPMIVATQPSVIAGQPIIVYGQPTMVSGQRTIVSSGQPTIVSSGQPTIIDNNALPPPFEPTIASASISVQSQQFTNGNKGTSSNI
jgi:hypothetical protein